ncbi:MAG: hypothetical protein ACJAVV_002920 [Alphaproteobacteria bacterium]|jgi:hypothetical protein
MEFTKLFDINITHDYYNGPCSDVKCVPLPPTAVTLQKSAMRILAQGSQYTVFYKNTVTGPLKKVSGQALYFAIVAQSTSFTVISDFTKTKRNVWVYNNFPSPINLASPSTYFMCPSTLVYQISQAIRPLTLSLRNANDDIVQQELISEENGLSEFSFLMQQYPLGLYTLREETASDNVLTKLAFLQDVPPTTIGIVKVDIDDNFYTIPASFVINYNARSETLNYYVVATNYDNADIQALAMKDAGFTDQSRSQILFNKLESASFTSQQIAPDLLHQNNAKVVLFTSESAVSRRQFSPRKLQLTLNNEVLIASLPIPGSSSVSADFFIHVAKA